MNGAVTAVIVMVAFCCVEMGQPPEEAIDACELRKRKSNFKVHLYSAVLLVSGLAEIYFLFSWRAQAVSDPQWRGELFTLSVVLSCLLTFLMAVLFVPVVLTHQGWMLELEGAASTGVANFDKDAWQKENGLNNSTIDTLTRFAALVSPILAAIGLHWST